MTEAATNMIEKSSQLTGSGSGQESANSLAQPFFFMVPFWGERYRRYYVDNLLPSLLAPNNLPLLRAEDGHRFLLATTREDWDAIIDLPIMKGLRQHAAPTLIEIPRPKNITAPGSTDAIVHQNVAQRLLVQAAFEAKAYGCLFSPDFIISDGMVAALLVHARAGRHLVLCPSLRQTEEPAIADLKRLGYLSTSLSPSETGTAIEVPQRVLADVMVRNLHPDLNTLEEGAPGQPPFAPFRYWRLPDNAGIILHTFHGVPVLMDYKAIEHHDVKCLDSNPFENVYFARNFGPENDLHVVRDSDEFCILSLTPAAIGQIKTSTRSSDPVGSSEGSGRRLLAALSVSYCTAGMPLKKELFKQSVRWHGGDLDEAAIARERAISAFIDAAVQYSPFTQAPAMLLLRYRDSSVFRWFVPYVRVLMKAFLGDRLIWSGIRQRLSFKILRPFKRAAFWFASGKDLDRIDPFHLSFRSTAGRRHVSESLFADDASNAVILGIGQSNMANEGEASACYEPTDEVYNFNFFNSQCYVAKDPLLGASVNRSNVLTRVGALLVERGHYRRVLLAPIAHGGTYVHDWSPNGKMFPRLQLTLELLRQLQIRITHVMWQQGESEAYFPNAEPEDWMRHFIAMAGAIRAAGTDAPIYVAQSTICCNDANEIIRTAQRRVIDPAAGILPGPDIDQIGRSQRFDGCHLSEAGLRRAAEMWCESLCRPKLQSVEENPE
jgi:Carbohydrate esterase, sialic acid-specific acetylesterase